MDMHTHTKSVGIIREVRYYRLMKAFKINISTGKKYWKKKDFFKFKKLTDFNKKLALCPPK